MLNPAKSKWLKHMQHITIRSISGISGISGISDARIPEASTLEAAWTATVAKSLTDAHTQLT